MEKTKIGEVEHYYNHLGVAVVNLTAPLKNGDSITVENALGQTVLQQIADSMQIGQNKIQEANAGDSIGLKVSAKVHKGNVVYKT